MAPSLQFLLGKPTLILGAISSALGAAVGLGALGWLARDDVVGTANYSIMVISNSVSLVTFSTMLLVAFSCPNEKYASFFGFLQFAAGKAVLMSFGGILQIAAGVLFAGTQQTAWIDYLIFISAGIMYTGMILVILRACCYRTTRQSFCITKSAASVVCKIWFCETNMSESLEKRHRMGDSGSRKGDYEAVPTKRMTKYRRMHLVQATLLIDYEHIFVALLAEMHSQPYVSTTICP